MKLNVLTIKGKITEKTVNLPDTIFGIEPHDHAIWLDVRAIRANQRQGTHATKGRSEVRGGGAKPFRQKGTGRARQGTIRAPHHVGGGRVFGPHPRKYVVSINRKVKRLARRSALSYRAKEKNIIIVENFSYDLAKTQDLKKMLGAFELDNTNVLLITEKNDPNICLSSRNLQKVEVREGSGFSTYDVMRSEKIILQEGALERISEVLGK
jgi:large subunit ribosomal protein L4